MSDRLISADKLVRTLAHHWNVYPLKKQELIATVDIIAAMPEAVVRCKDCKFNPKNAFVGCPMSGLSIRDDNDFCSKGERREDEAD